MGVYFEKAGREDRRWGDENVIIFGRREEIGWKR
jgi:hypothetical protein